MSTFITPAEAIKKYLEETPEERMDALNKMINGNKSLGHSDMMMAFGMSLQIYAPPISILTHTPALDCISNEEWAAMRANTLKKFPRKISKKRPKKARLFITQYRRK